MIVLFTSRFGMGVLRAKLLAEGILFLANFLVQRDIIFTGGKDPSLDEAALAAVPIDETSTAAPQAGAGTPTPPG